jgi:hypothetical protein
MSYDSREDTEKHIRRVNEYMTIIFRDIQRRGLLHDMSKLEPLEKEGYDKFTPFLKKYTFGSKEYFETTRKMKPILEHHYMKNRHHPEHFPDGIKGMNLVDLVELISDWKAASERDPNGDVMRGIDINAKRFNISDDLVQILKNTVKEYFND